MQFKCDKCDKQATIHLTDIADGKKSEVHLCEECAAAEGLTVKTSVPLSQLQMLKWMLNDVARHQYQPDTSRLLGYLFDGVARHTQEGLDFVARAQSIGWREAVRERDQPFGDYGQRDRSGGAAER